MRVDGASTQKELVQRPIDRVVGRLARGGGSRRLGPGAGRGDGSETGSGG
jgi:hypothetical protein